MAVYLSWADRLREYEDELNPLLAQDPKNIAARTHLARVLSWSGALSDAIRQADLVLLDAPDHKEALLVKPDALQWQGRFPAAMPVYEKIMSPHAAFVVLVGLPPFQHAVCDSNLPIVHS